jgi:hypothetical protein
MRLSPLGTSTTIWSIVPAPDNDGWWWVWNNRWNEWQGKPNTRRTPAPVPLWLPQIPRRDLIRARTRATIVKFPWLSYGTTLPGHTRPIASLLCTRTTRHVSQGMGRTVLLLGGTHGSVLRKKIRTLYFYTVHFFIPWRHSCGICSISSLTFKILLFVHRVYLSSSYESEKLFF